MTSKRILVVDDDPDLLFLAAHGLKSGNLPYEVSTAANAVTALAMAKAQPFAVIVTDYMMPDMTGLELIASVRAIAPETAFIMMTAHHDTGGVRRTAMSMGVSGFVSKPFVLADLLNAINQAAAPAEPLPSQTALNGFLNQTIIDRLAEFQRQTSAWCVMLIDAKGAPLHVVGAPNGARGPATAFIARHLFGA
jgi:CheY-like chemotaxis protein